MKALFLTILFALAASPMLLAQENVEARKAGAVASDFFNDCIKAQPKMPSYKATNACVKKNPLASPTYKAAVEKIYMDALREDPDIGYEADALLGAQDYPDGVRIKQIRASGNKAVVDLIGVDPFPMPLRVTLIKQDGNWLIDGSGDLLR
jgi:hypothetical protein